MSNSGRYRSKKDDLAKISVYVFITNFPDNCSAKDLFNVCKQYGHVVDSFIPNKRSNAGKRFSFVRFINVFNNERLVDNLSTVWIGRRKLQANLTRCERSTSRGDKKMAKEKDGRKENINHSVEKVNGDMNTKLFSTSQNSFAHAVIGKNHMEGVENDMSPVVVLDDECLVEKDISKLLFGRVKEFASLANLKVAICNEGFEELKISYMGESRVKLDFGSVESIKKFQENVGIGSWFSCIKHADMDFVIEGRVAWVEIEGIPFKLWSNNTFKRIANRASETTGWVPDFADEEEEDQEENLSKDGGLDNDVSGINDGESEMDEVPETFFGEEGVKKTVAEKGGKDEQEGDSLEFPPSFTPNEDSVAVTLKDAEIQNYGEYNVVRSSKNHSTDPFGLYAILNKKMGASHNVEKAKFESSYPPGYLPNEDGFSKVVTPNDVEELSGQNIQKEEGECVSIKGQNRKKATSDNHDSCCSGHFKKSTGPHSGGSIIQRIEELVHVGQVMGYDMCWGNFSFDYAYSEAVGKSVGNLCVWDDTMFQKLNRTVSDYFVMIRGMWVPSGKNLRSHICNWEGDVITMGDFKEVLTSSERFGSIFNKIGVKFFNEFIANACLVEIPLGGCSYTWCHKSANKMSKLDRFLISDSLLSTSPGISSASLDRYLSDHRLILMRESYQDYGPTPFKFYHYRFEYHDFEKFMVESWKEMSISDSNDYRRQEIVCKIQDLEKIEIMEMAQKAKIKWAVEGDENSKYYHGVINKKRSKLAIRGVLVDGTWIESPPLVKKAFFDHFKSQFEQPCSSDILLDSDFTNKDCGVDKSPGPDGFTFGFYRRYWNLIEGDIFKAVDWFFQHGIIPNGGNLSFITLIPKIPNANMVKDFRPISLIGSVYKIIAKILANRLVTVLGDIVSESQYAFMKDRQILDGPFILNELVQWCKVVDAGLFSGIRLDKSTSITHLFYADDAIFMGQWNCFNIDIITRVLDIFHKASGLRINMTKSKLLRVSVDQAIVEQAVLERMVTRLSRWKIKTISIGGRLTLLKSVLGLTPLYHMSMFKVPKKVLQLMETIRSRFFNGADSTTRKHSWVSWKKTMASKDTRAIHGPDGKIEKKANASYPPTWPSIIQEIGVMQSKGIDILNYIKPKCGNGSSTSFWKDTWRGEIAFKELFPRLYMLENMKDGTVAKKLAHEDLEWSFRRNSRSGSEMQQLDSLKDKIVGVILGNSRDRWTWSLEGSGEFLVSFLRKAIDLIHLPQSGIKTRWIKEVPIKINILAWKVSNDYLPTRTNLSRRERMPSFNSIVRAFASLGHDLVVDMKRKVGNEDRDVRQTQNSKYSESLETPPIKRKVGRPKKSVRANENKSSSVKRRGRPRKSNDEEKNQTIGSKGKKHKASSKSKKKKKSKISDAENNRNSKIRTRTTPTTLFNAMAILNDDRKSVYMKWVLEV
uniref:RNA-directed DNA polymerase, eukaryota n=1 Tax=Tanacetum cinerariifolium TaxID=118510 RepID=A0A699GVZ6_TANCI|nr:RNA-directed DNA polymerase, eukaryota [Tanacetum cinerariifolium]